MLNIKHSSPQTLRKVMPRVHLLLLKLIRWSEITFDIVDSCYFANVDWVNLTLAISQVCGPHPFKEGETSKLKQVVKRQPAPRSYLHLAAGSTSLRTGSWSSCPSWRRPARATARSFWSRRSDNAAFSSTSSPTPSPTSSGRRWSVRRCRRWWSMSPRTGECSPNQSILRWGCSRRTLVCSITPLHCRLFTCFPWISSEPSPPPTTPRWAPSYSTVTAPSLTQLLLRHIFHPLLYSGGRVWPGGGRTNPGGCLAAFATGLWILPQVLL